jgi:hypothetical protein
VTVSLVALSVPSMVIVDGVEGGASTLREVAQLRKLRRAFRDPQERLEDQALSRSFVVPDSSQVRVHEPAAAYGRPPIRAAIRHWWCQGDYEAIVALGRQLDPALLDEEPLVRVYLDAAKAQSIADAQRQHGEGEIGGSGDTAKRCWSDTEPR